MLLFFYQFFFSGGKIEIATYMNLFKTFLAFSFITSSVYSLNDIIDKENDAKHPFKKHRPIASNKVRKKVAGLNGVFLLILGFSYFLFFEKKRSVYSLTIC